MRRSIAVVWHASFSVIAAALYFFFVLPRWWELMGQTSHTLGTVLRIVTAALIGLAALPVVFTLLRTRRPELGTPLLALRLRVTSIALHVLAAALILGAAISEIWLDLDTAGTWLFGIYGAAAAIALLGILAFYLAFVAELPPPPPKPLKPKSQTQRRGRGKAAAEAESAETPAETPAEAESAPPADETTTEEADEADPDTDTDADTADDTADEPTAEAADEPTAKGGRFRNRRPANKDSTTSRRRRTRGGVAVED
ncbi:hypothetical protein ACN27E_19960 [Mycobacterium sp. WMMD1722]|uniref:hypothetical protein n=1 Tax=Mycobacterium sp. WMMD1722 TaxID=3404117 RepID=UPI003BF4C606